MALTPVCSACYTGGEESIRQLLMEVWGPDIAAWTFFTNGSEALGVLLTAPPDILVCGMTLPDMSGLDVARMLKEENVYSQIPIVLCLSAQEAQEYAGWAELVADDFLVIPSPLSLIRARLELSRNRAARTLDANPLTRLPGNTSIIKRTQGLIDQRQDFALGYCDLDYFKPYNDKYGFARGDEVLMMTARVILNAVHALKLPMSFVGHVGGDDYVFIVPADAAETVCKHIIAAFDGIIPQFYDEDDLAKGGIISTDRQNEVRWFPVMAISIAVVIKQGSNIKHYGEASSLAMNLKKVAKKSAASSYAIDRRAAPEAPEKHPLAPRKTS
ncbi:diguanylate cyclase response regulator [Deltaproteobacteria bacterium]|nr:diguanylate cyclase response regulator [Deltaproteobacteria bacterium]